MSKIQPLTALQLLQQGKALIENEKNFAQGAMIESRYSVLKPRFSSWWVKRHPYLFKFCSMGALHYLEEKHGASNQSKEAYYLLSHSMGHDISGFSDGTTHQRVLAAWDHAITMAKMVQSITPHIS